MPKRLHKMAVSSILVITMLLAMMTVNSAPAAATPVMAATSSNGTCSASAALSMRQMNSTYGAGWLNDLAGAVTNAIDAGCAVGGVAAALGAAIDPIGGAFCAGWGLGRLFSM